MELGLFARFFTLKHDIAGAREFTWLALDRIWKLGADEQRIGTIQRVMIDTMSGNATYAVTSFGWFLGIGDDYYNRADNWIE